ncbi:MAG: o-succinylbenzoate--CoA ligase [Bdellovibrionaceae bacterium]|nr:o-succinylbenzoate--CoA ligase [Pseudobdellovibrionaceae bacterium]
MTPEFELDWLKRWAAYAPRSVAIQDGDSGKRFTYSEFFQAAARGAQALSEKFGITRGDRVAVLSLNELDYVVLFFALQRLGATLVPINFRLTAREIAHVLKDCEPKLLVTQDEFSAALSDIDPAVLPRTLLLPRFGEWTVSGSLFDGFQSEAEDIAMIIYTSGTTGAPKGAMISHRMIFWNSLNTTLRLDLRQDDSTVIFLPFFHTGGWNVLTTPFLHRGGKVIFLKKFDADLVLQLCEQEKTTLLFGVPTTMDLLARSPRFGETDLSSIRYAIVGGEPMPLELIQTWHHKHIPIRQGYGLTEFGPSVFSLNEEDAIRKIGSIGFPNFYVDVKIAREDGSECGPDEVGELLLKGPAIMTGYWKNARATEETCKNGWLHTGDLVRRDDEGYFFVVGRKKDMFKSGGENVYPAELEKVLRSCPGVREVAVIGVPDEKWGEVGKAFVVKETRDLTLEKIQDHCLANLAKFKVPKHFVFLEALPKSDSGKILKKDLH